MLHEVHVCTDLEKTSRRANIGTVLLCREPAETTGCSQSPASYLKETLTFAREL